MDQYPEDYKYLKTKVQEWPFLKYSLIQIETNLVNADEEIMNAFANLVSDPSTQNELMQLILDDYKTALNQIERLMRAPAEERRVSRLENNKLRKEALGILHEIQIRSLVQWRETKSERSRKERSNFVKTFAVG